MGSHGDEAPARAADQFGTYGASVGRRDKAYVLTFRDLPDLWAFGDSLDEVLEKGAFVLQAHVTDRIDHGGDLPLPTHPQQGEFPVALPRELAERFATHTSR